MFGPNRKLRDKLLDQELPDPKYSKRYEMELKKMFEKPLNPIQRVVTIMSLLFSAAMMILFIILASVVDVPTEVRVVFVLGAAFAAAWAFGTILILKKGYIHLLKDESWQGGWAWGVTVMISTASMMIAGNHPEHVESVFIVVTSIVFLIGGGVFMINSRINAGEMRTREKLLEIEIKLADLLDQNKK